MIGSLAIGSGGAFRELLWALLDRVRPTWERLHTGAWKIILFRLFDFIFQVSATILVATLVIAVF